MVCVGSWRVTSKGALTISTLSLIHICAPKLGKDGKPMKDKHGKVIYEPYRIKVLNTINFKKSMHYNPFAYILSLIHICVRKMHSWRAKPLSMTCSST